MHPQNQKTLTRITSINHNKDPIAVIDFKTHPDNITTDTQNIEALDQILSSDPSLTIAEKTDLYRQGIDLRLDHIYRIGAVAMPLSGQVIHLKEASSFFEATEERLQQLRDTLHDKPQERWAVQIKRLDLEAYVAHAFAKDAETTLKGTEAGKKLYVLAESQLRTVLFSSLRLMQEMSQAATSQSDEELASDARGTLFEVMLVAYSRLKTFEAQTIDKEFTRSALDREDRPHNNHVYPKRGFDFAIVTDGMVRLLQAKNHNSNEQYAAPIEVIEDPNYHHTLNNMPTYIADFRIALENNPHPAMKTRLDVAYERLESIFGQHLKPKHIIDIRD